MVTCVTVSVMVCYKERGRKILMCAVVSVMVCYREG